MDIIVIMLQAIGITILATILMLAVTIGAFVILIIAKECFEALKKKGGKK